MQPGKIHYEQGTLYVRNNHIVWVCWILKFCSLVCDGVTENCLYSLFFFILHDFSFWKEYQSVHNSADSFIMPFESWPIMYSKSKKKK